MKIKPFFCTVLFFYISFQLNSQVFNSQKDSLIVDRFYQGLYDYKFSTADSVLQNIRNNNISPKISNLLYISYNWWQIISGENDQDNIDSLFKKIDFNIELIKSNTGKSEPTQEEFIQLIFLYSYKSRLNNYQSNRLASFSAFKQSFNYFEELIPCDSGYCDMYNFIAGMYYALGGHLHEQFSPIFIFGLNRDYADTEKGYQLLNQCTYSKNKQIQVESIYFLMKLYFEVQDDPVSAAKYSVKLVNMYPDNLVFRFNHFLALNEQKKTTEAEMEYQKLIQYSEINKQLTLKQKKHFREEYEKLKK